MENSIDFAVLRAFLLAHVENYEQLEALLVLRRAGETRTAAAIASKLKIEVPEAEQALDRLVKSKLLEPEVIGAKKVFRYSPDTPELSSNVELLVSAYEERTVKVVELMTTNAIERMRTNALRIFAEGFRLGGPKKNG